MKNKGKTYAEKRGVQPFNWNWFLLKARMGLYPFGAPEAVKIRAQDWVTCACGNQCAAIPRHDEECLLGVPCDHDLKMHGIDFFQAVSAREWKTAMKVLKAIEKRSAELLAAL